MGFGVVRDPEARGGADQRFKRLSRHQNLKKNQKPNLGFSHEIVWTILGFHISKV